MLKLKDNKKAVSAVVATVLLIALTLAVVGIVWAVVNNLVQDRIQSSESCGILNEVELNPRYTCYNQTTGNDELWFYITVGEVENLEDILVSISGQGTGSSFKITESLANLTNYPSRTPATGIPGKNEGNTYIYTLPAAFTQAPETVTISPVISGEQCGASSTINQFDECSSLA